MLPAFTLTDLGTLGGTESAAYDMNPVGQVVGRAATDRGAHRAALWGDEAQRRDGHAVRRSFVACTWRR
jgi:hypothetical protein